jgi:hypothetical protein
MQEAVKSATFILHFYKVPASKKRRKDGRNKPAITA